MLFGPKELPKIGKTIAKALNDFKRASNELKDTWQRELNDLERETQDIRNEITKETDTISQTTSSYGESYYNHDTAYDYGAYGYPATTTDSTVDGTVAAPADTAQITAGDGGSTGETTVSDGSLAAEPAGADAAPVISAAQGTVPTHLSPAVPPHASESATRDDVSSL